jgi:hypothetical protein
MKTKNGKKLKKCKSLPPESKPATTFGSPRGMIAGFVLPGLIFHRMPLPAFALSELTGQVFVYRFPKERQ